MIQTRPTLTFARRALLALLPVLTLVAGWTWPATAPATAAFPGKNGKIVFASNRTTPDNPTGDYKVYAINSDGSGLTQLTDNTSTDDDPAWSPNGKRIAFGSTRDGDDEIFAMRANGGNPTNLTKNNWGDFQPAWSPDGKKIAFMCGQFSEYELYAMNADGTKQTNRTNADGSDYGPDWQPKP